MKEFKNYHPLVNFIYFLAVIGLSMFLMHPFCLTISLFASFVSSILAKGRRAALFGVLGILPLMIGTALLNPVFNHQGVTIISYLPDGNPLTLEAVIYGIAAASMLGSVICWFSCYNYVMTDDKFMYLFGKTIPSLALVFSMTIGFVPKFKNQFRNVVKAQRGLGVDISQGSLVRRFKCLIKILSVMITWMLESSVETSASMKCRGYGLKKRTAFSLYSFTRRDAWALAFVAVAILYVVCGYIYEATYFSYFPVMISGNVNIFSISVFGVYFFLCMMPIIVEGKEWLKWRVMKSKI